MRAFLIGCVVLLLAVGCAGVGSKAPQKEKARSPEATASEEEARCEGTRTAFKKWGWHFTTNDLPGCPKGGLLLGTDINEGLAGLEGDDEIRGLAGQDFILGGEGNDVIYAGPGDDTFLAGVQGAGDDVIYGGDGADSISGGNGDDVIYGGDGNDFITESSDSGHDKLYCGKGKDQYDADKNDYVSSNCEKKNKWGPPIQ